MIHSCDYLLPFNEIPFSSSFKGTVLDRIDFNVEQACVKTDDGLKQLQKVESDVVSLL